MAHCVYVCVCVCSTYCKYACSLIELRRVLIVQKLLSLVIIIFVPRIKHTLVYCS